MKKNWIDKIKAMDQNVESNSLASEGHTSGDSELNKIEAGVIKYKEEDSQNIVRSFDSFQENPSYVNISNLLYNEIFKNPTTLLDAPIEAIRIYLILVHQSKTVQFNQKNAPYTESLFENEFKHIKNASVSFTIPNNIISPSRETKRIREALDILSSDNTSHWVKTKAPNGNIIDTKLRFIELASYSRGQTYIVINTYWLEKMANIESYNKVLFNLAYSVPSTKNMFFALWLNTIPVYEQSEFKKETYTSWTKISLATFKTKFGLEDKSSDYIVQKFLKPMQSKLFEFNDKSFAFHFDRNYFFIAAVHIKNNNVIAALDKGDKYKTEVKYAVNYLQRRHKIDKDSIEHISSIYLASPTDKNLMKEAYESLKKKVRLQKESMTSLVGFQFLDKWQEEIILHYKTREAFKNFPKGYPKVNTSH